MGVWARLLTTDPGGPGGPKGPGAPSLPGGPARPYQKNKARKAEGDLGPLLSLRLPRLGAPDAGPGPPSPHPLLDSEVLTSPSPYMLLPAPLPALRWRLADPSLLEGLADQGTQRYQEHRGDQGGPSLPGTEITEGGVVPAGPLPRTSLRMPSSGSTFLFTRRDAAQFMNHSIKPSRSLKKKNALFLPPPGDPCPQPPPLGWGSDLPSDLEDQLAQGGPGPRLLGHPSR